jgi:hypothetical protein
MLAVYDLSRPCCLDEDALLIARETNHPRKSGKERSPISAMAFPPTLVLKTQLSRRSGFDFERLSSQRCRKIIPAYQKLLGKWHAPVGPESLLPFPKDLIEAAIYRELLDNPFCDQRMHLEVAYARIESFIPDEEYRVLSEFKKVGMFAQKLANNGELHNIVVLARLLTRAKGDRAVMIQERVSEKMREKLEEIRKLCP